MSIDERISVLEKDNADLKVSVTSLREQLQAVLSLVSTQPVQKKEAYYQALLSTKLNAGHMRIEGVGITDITTDDAHIEIKHWGRFQEVPGQLAKYRQAVFRPRLCVYFFGSEPPKERYGQILTLMEAAKIEVYAFAVDDEPQKLETANPALNSPGMRALMQFEGEQIVAEKRAVLQWRPTLAAFRAWAKEKCLTLPQSDKAIKELFITRFGKFVDSRYGNVDVYGWRHFKLQMDASGVA